MVFRFGYHNCAVLLRLRLTTLDFNVYRSFYMHGCGLASLVPQRQTVSLFQILGSRWQAFMSHWRFGWLFLGHKKLNYLLEPKILIKLAAESGRADHIGSVL